MKAGVWVWMVLIPVIWVSGCSSDCVSPPSIDYDSITIDTVHYGRMPQHVRGSGVISRVRPDSRARIRLPGISARLLKIGQPALVKVASLSEPLPAQVTQIADGAGGQAQVELSFTHPLPPGVQVDDAADALIQYGQIENALYVNRGAFSTENADMTIFRVGPDKTATRVTVRFGAITSELIEIKSGLQQGDKVIVSDMSRYDNVDRIRIEYP